MSPGSSIQRIVLCMKWGTKYGAEYVNRLYGMVERHLSGPFRFVCLTDNSMGVRPDVECMPLPTLDLAPGADRGWPKLTTFKADLHGLRGTALFLDLDVVIVGDITPFFELPGQFYIIKDWKRPWRVTGNSSVYRFQIGAHVDVLQHFIQNQALVRKRHRNEQEYLSHALQEQGRLRYWPASWCCSYKYHCIPRWPANYWRAPGIPPDARIVIFHGEVNPPDALAGRRNRPLRFARPAPWVAEHWQE
ncbi:MAG: glycosyltransferase [Rubrivivax sp.]|nr:glycosyltransferase [Rubrivivax sp.]